METRVFLVYIEFYIEFKEFFQENFRQFALMCHVKLLLSLPLASSGSLHRFLMRGEWVILGGLKKGELELGTEE